MKLFTKKILATLCSSVLLFALVACSNEDKAQQIAEKQVLKVGASPSPHAEILEHIKPALAEKGIELQVQIFTDYILPNQALESGDIDANYFQHKPYLDDFNQKNGTHLVSVAPIHFEPLGIYPGKTADIKDLKDGAQIAVPNDTTNEARALQLLASQGLFELDKNVGLQATPTNITSNPKNFKIVELEAAQLPRSLSDVDLAVINGNYAIAGGVDKKVLATEKSDSEGAQTYANIIAVKSGDENNELIKTLIATLQSDDVKTFLKDKYNVTVVPVF